MSTTGTCVLHFAPNENGTSTDVLLEITYTKGMVQSNDFLAFIGAANAAVDQAGVTIATPQSYADFMNAFAAATCTSLTKRGGNSTECINLASEKSPEFSTKSYFALKVDADEVACLQLVLFKGIATPVLTAVFGPGLDTLPTDTQPTTAVPFFNVFVSPLNANEVVSLELSIGTPNTSTASIPSGSSMLWIIVAVVIVVVLCVLVKLHGHGSQKKASSSPGVPHPPPFPVQQPMQYTSQEQPYTTTFAQQPSLYQGQPIPFAQQQ